MIAWVHVSIELLGAYNLDVSVGPSWRVIGFESHAARRVKAEPLRDKEPVEGVLVIVERTPGEHACDLLPPQP